MRILLFLISIVVLFPSCGVSYQVYYMQPEKANRGDKMIFENKDIKVGYDLWCEGGNSGFAIYNKTNKPIYIDLENTHFILNGVANTYFQNQTYTTGSSVTVKNASSVGFRNTNSSVWGSGARFGRTAYVNTNSNTSSSSWSIGNETSYTTMSAQTVTEKRIITIPPRAMKIFPGFSINTSLYNVNHFAWENKPKTFNKVNTLISVNNVIAYRFKESEIDSNILFENGFWLKGIVNHRKKSITKDVSGCRNFFITYKKQNT